MGRRKKRMEQEKEKLPLGAIYQAKKGGNYYLRYQIHGRRNNVNLKTDDYDEALKEYQRLLPTLQATTVEVVGQILDRRYYEKFQNCGLPIRLIGVNFDSSKGRIDAWEEGSLLTQ